MPAGEQIPISQLNLFLFSPASVELFPPRRKELALAYITRFSGPELSSALLFAAGIQHIKPQTLVYAQSNFVMPEIQELKTRLNFCKYLWETPEGTPVRTYDQVEAQVNAMRSERADLLRRPR